LVTNWLALLHPMKIRGSYATLREATIAGNLPTLSQSRGKIFFIMQGGAEEEYIASHNTLQGRAMFMYTGNKNDDHACFIIKNNSISSKTEIQQLVGQGFMVRTRTDANTDEARTG
jgi:formamidopyrimidine-DNA glycosylase